MKKKKKNKNLPEVGKLYRLFCESDDGVKLSVAYGLNLEENLLVCIPNVVTNGRPTQSFLVSGTGEFFHWCFVDTEPDKHHQLEVWVKKSIHPSGYTTWLEEEVDTDVE